MSLLILMILVMASPNHLMAHTTMIRALSLSRVVCSIVAAAAVVGGALLIASTARKALSCPVGTGIFSGLG